MVASRNLKEAQAKAQLVLDKQPNNPDAHLLMANVSAALNDFPKADSESRKAIDLAPNRATYYLGAGAIQVYEKRYSEAEGNLKKAESLDPSSLTAVISLARLYETTQRWPEAEQELKHGISVAPKEVGPRVELARVLLVNNRKADAEAVLRQAKDNLSDNPEGYRLLAEYYVGQHDEQKAAAEFGQLHQQHPKDVRVTKSYAELLLATGATEEAKKLAEEVLKANPKDAEATILRGQILTREGHPEQAVTVLEGSLKLDADNPVLHYHLGNALMGTGKTDRAQSEWHEAVRLRPDYVEAQRKLATWAQQTGNTEQLALSADQLIKSVPSSPEGYLFRAHVAMVQKRLPDAEADIQHAISLAPRYWEPYARMGLLRGLQGRLPDAEKAYQQALQLNPGAGEAVQGLANVYLAQKQLPKALAAVSAQVAKAPNSSMLYILQADLLARSGRDKFADAITSAQKAVELDHGTGPGVSLLARLYVANGDADKALAVCQQGLSKDPSNVALLLQLGSLQEVKGQVPQAEETYRKVLQVQPGNPLAANNLAFQMLEHNENPDVALTLAQTARAALPNAPDIADTLAWAYYKKGVYRSAIDLLEDAAQKSPENANIRYHLGMAYEKSNDPAKARASLQKALQLDPKSPHAAEIAAVLAR